MYSQLVFYTTSGLIVIFSLLTLKCKNIFYSLLSAMIVFYMAGALFLLLGSEYNAIIQLAIYGFAIPVILGIAIMFVNFKNNKPKQKKDDKQINFEYLLFVIASIFTLAMIYIVMTSLLVVPDSFNITNMLGQNNYNNIEIFAKGIFKQYVFAFELVSMILTIIVVGLTILKRRVR